MRMALLCSLAIEGWAKLSPVQPSTPSTSVAGRGRAGLLAPGAPWVVGVPSPRAWGHVSGLDTSATGP